MPLVIVETPGAANANSYESLAEFKTYIANRLHVPASVTAANDTTLGQALVMATKGLDRILTRARRLEILEGRTLFRFYITRPHWTGSPATSTQSLAWPRSGMVDRNGNAIAIDVIPQELKDAESEMAILAIDTDLTADNAIVVQGITSIKAGPVALDFKGFIQKRSLPDAVVVTLVPSWITDELVEQAVTAQFSTLGTRR